jgi:hypothetical protein
MAKNTGRGSRYAANSPTAGQFLKAKERGGAFRGIHDERSWSDRHPHVVNVLVAVVVFAVIYVAAAVL